LNAYDSAVTANVSPQWDIQVQETFDSKNDLEVCYINPIVLIGTPITKWNIWAKIDIPKLETRFRAGGPKTKALRRLDHKIPHGETHDVAGGRAIDNAIEPEHPIDRTGSCFNETDSPYHACDFYLNDLDVAYLDRSGMSPKKALESWCKLYRREKHVGRRLVETEVSWNNTLDELKKHLDAQYKCSNHKAFYKDNGCCGNDGENGNEDKVVVKTSLLEFMGGF